MKRNAPVLAPQSAGLQKIDCSIAAAIAWMGSARYADRQQSLRLSTYATGVPGLTG
jgi:hypothetical protein